MSSANTGNRFEFVVMAGARARQLMRGAVPRVANPGKVVATAQREVKEGAVVKDVRPDAGPAADSPDGAAGE